MDLSIASSLFETTNSQNGQSSLHTTIFEGVQGEESAWTSEECDQKLKADHEISSQSRGVKDVSSVSAKEEQTLSVSLSMNENSGETVSAQHRSIDLSPSDKTAKVEVSRHEEPIISSSSLHPVQVLERNEEDKEQEGEQLSQSKQPAEPENHFDAKDAVQLLNHENSKETTSELINENQDHSEFTEVRIKEDSSSERGGEPNKSDQINSQSSEPVDIPPPQTVALENTSQKESHVTASPLSTKYSENELFNLVGMSLSKNFVKNFNNASAANSPSHTMPSASLEVQTASVSEIVHQRQDHAGKERRELKIVADQPLASDSPESPLMQGEAKEKSQTADLAISPNKRAALEPVNWQSANGEEDLSTNQLSALLNRMQHRLNDITANDEDFTPPLPSPKRISRLLSGEISIMSDLTFSNSENNTPLTTPVQSFLINQTSLDKSPQIKRQSGVPSSQLDKTTSPSLLRKAAAPTLEVKVIQPPSRDRKDQKRGRSSDALAKSSGGPRNRSKSPASSTYSETVLGRTTVFAFGRAIHANERGRSKTPVENRNANTGNTIRASSKGRSKSPTATSSMNTVSRLSGRSKSSSSAAYPTTYRSQSPAINNRSSTRAHSKSPASSLKIPFSNINARARSKSPAINSRLYSTPKNDFKARRARSLTPNPKRSAGMKSSARSKSPAVTFSRSTIDRASAAKKRSASADGWRQLSKGDYPRRSSFNDPTMSFLNRVAANSQRMSRSVSSSRSVITELAQGGSFVINSLGSRVSLLSSWNRAATDSPPVMNPAAPRRSSVGAASSRDSMGALTASRATRSSYPVGTNRSSAVPPSKLSQDKSVRPQATTPLKAGGGTKANTLTPPATSTSRICSTITNSGQSATPTSAVSQRGLQTPSKYTPPGKQQFVGKVHISPLANQQSSSDPSVTNALSGGRLSQQYEHSGEKQSKAASWYSSNYAAETAVKTVRGSNSKQITITITDKQTKHKRANSDSSGAIKIDQSQTSMRSASPKVVSANIKHSTNKERAFSSNSPANSKKAISSDDESPEKIAESKIKPESSPIIRKILSAEVAEDHKMTEQREQENAAIDTFPTHRDADSTPISSPWNEERQDRRSSPLSNISTVPPPIVTILSSESPDPVGFGRISRRESPKRSFSPRKIDSNTLNRAFESQVASSSSRRRNSRSCD